MSWTGVCSLQVFIWWKMHVFESYVAVIQWFIWSEFPILQLWEIVSHVADLLLVLHYCLCKGTAWTCIKLCIILVLSISLYSLRVLLFVLYSRSIASIAPITLIALLGLPWSVVWNIHRQLTRGILSFMHRISSGIIRICRWEMICNSKLSNWKGLWLVRVYLTL